MSGGEFVSLEEDCEEYIDFVLLGVPAVGTGEFLCLEEDTDEFDSFVLLGVVGVVPPPPIVGGGLRKRIPSRRQYYITVKEIMRILAKLGLSQKETRAIENELAYHEKLKMDIKNKLAIPMKITISLKGHLGKKHIEKSVLTAILSNFFKDTKFIENELGLPSSEDISIQSSIPYLREQKELEATVRFWRSEKAFIASRVGVFYEELIGLATKLGLSKEDAIEIVGKVRPSMEPLLRKIWEIRKLRREEDNE